MAQFCWPLTTEPDLFNNALVRSLRDCFKICYVARLLRRAVLEILMYAMYTPVSALRTPCTRAAFDAFKTHSYRLSEIKFPNFHVKIIEISAVMYSV